MGNPFKYHVVCGYLGVLLAANRVFSLLSDNTGMVPRTFWTWFGRFFNTRPLDSTDRRAVGKRRSEGPPLATLLLEPPFQPLQKSWEIGNRLESRVPSSGRPRTSDTNHPREVTPLSGVDSSWYIMFKVRKTKKVFSERRPILVYGARDGGA